MALLGNLSRRILSYFVVLLLTTALLLPLGLAAAEGEETGTPSEEPTAAPTAAPAPDTEPQQIDGTKGIKLILGYDVAQTDGAIIKVRTEYAEIKISTLLSLAKNQQYTYSYFSAGVPATESTQATDPYVVMKTGKGVTMQQLLDSSNLSGVVSSSAKVSFNEGSAIDLSWFSGVKNTYSELYKYIFDNGSGSISYDSDGTYNGRSDVPTILAIWSGYNAYSLGADGSVISSSNASQEKYLSVLRGQDDPTHGGSIHDYYDIKSITFILPNPPTVGTLLQQTWDISVGSTRTIPSNITEHDVYNKLTEEYLKSVIVWTNADSSVAWVNADRLVSADKEGTTTIMGAIDGQIKYSITVNVHPKYEISFATGTTDTVSSMPQMLQKEYGVDLTLPTTTPTRTDYAFIGWNTKEDGTGTTYQAGATYSDNASVTLYAQWKVPSFTVSFDANEPTGQEGKASATAPIEVIKGVKASIPAAPTLAGYTFVFWNTKADGSGASYVAGSTTEISDGVTVLYACWKRTQYTITFDPNNSNGKMIIDGTELTIYKKVVDSGFLLDTTQFVCKNVSTKAYPKHWLLVGTTKTYLSANQSQSYPSGSDRYITVTSDITLQAVWTTTPTASPTSTISVSYNANAGSDKVSNLPGTQKANKGSTITISTQTPTRAGYTFGGWNTKANGTGTNYSGGSKTSSSLTLYAKWTQATPTPAASPTPTPTPEPTPSPTPEPTLIPDAIMDDDVVVEPVESVMEPVIFIDNVGATDTPNPDEDGDGEQSEPTPTPNPWNEQNPDDPTDADVPSGSDATYAIVGIANGVLLVAGGCLAVIKFNLQL
ncbi:MAG: InlB B-repeat-containing protein [Eubacteriales bacterium]|nr:InlB B-repeat-containing protein [Eubacteriales bacterium]